MDYRDNVFPFRRGAWKPSEIQSSAFLAGFNVGIALIIAGLMLVDSGVKGTASSFFALLKDDGTAFVAWLIVIAVLGVIGMSATLRPVSNIFLILIVIVFFLKNYTNVLSGLTTISTGAATPAAPLALPAPSESVQ